MASFLKIGKASEMHGREYFYYRAFEILPGFLALATFSILVFLSYFKPIAAAYIIISFDVYWLLLVLYFGIHLVSSYRKMQMNIRVDWECECRKVLRTDGETGLLCGDVIHLVIIPTCTEAYEILLENIDAIARDGFRNTNMIIVLAIEDRVGMHAYNNALRIQRKFNDVFRDFLITQHPDSITGEIRGKGSNQAWAIREVKSKVIDKAGIDEGRIMVSVFDADTVVANGYFFCLTHRFLTTQQPYHASYQPVPIYHNNIWDASFFSRVAASSNTFWQMIQQIRQEKLATYSSHSMTYKTLVDLDFWSTNMISEDSRIFWHALLYYNGNYRVEPLFFPVFMDICMDVNTWQTMKSLYRQQRRWGWGVENVPYLIYGIQKKWGEIERWKMIKHLFIQIYGFHSWATNALIIAIFGWMPVFLGGDEFNSLMLSSNLTIVTTNLMRLAMIGIVVSAILSRMMLPKDESHGTFRKKTMMLLEWAVLPFTIIVFGAIPALDAQIRLLLGKYLGFWVTPKER